LGQVFVDEKDAQGLNGLLDQTLAKQRLDRNTVRNQLRERAGYGTSAKSTSAGFFQKPAAQGSKPKVKNQDF
jgi:hypothetical protein